MKMLNRKQKYALLLFTVRTDVGSQLTLGWRSGVEEQICKLIISNDFHIANFTDVTDQKCNFLENIKKIKMLGRNAMFVLHIFSVCCVYVSVGTPGA